MGTNGDKQERQGDNMSFHTYACFHNELGFKYNAKADNATGISWEQKPVKSFPSRALPLAGALSDGVSTVDFICACKSVV